MSAASPLVALPKFLMSRFSFYSSMWMQVHVNGGGKRDLPSVGKTSCFCGNPPEQTPEGLFCVFISVFFTTLI